MAFSNPEIFWLLAAIPVIFDFGSDTGYLFKKRPGAIC